LTVARGGGTGNHASSRAIAGTPRDAEWFDCTRCKKGHPWPCYFDPQVPNHKKPDWWHQHHGDPANVTGTTSGKRDRHSTGTTQRPVSKTRERFGGNKIAAHLVKPEGEGDSDDNGVEPEVSLVQMEIEVGIASDNLSTDIDDVFATERSDKPPSSLELFMAQLALEETDAGYVPAHLSRQNVEREPKLDV
jgi:hypothetical protein